MKLSIRNQEVKCIEAKFAIDFLLTKLFEIEDFNDYKIWNIKLKKLKKQIDNIYWNI